VTSPRRFDVILTENLFGDILSDELAVIGGSVGILPSASVGSAPPGLFEPIHGSAPDIAGLDIANPAGTISAAAMLLGHIGRSDLESLLADAVETTLADGCRTADLGGSDRCSEFGAETRERLRARLGARDAHLALIATNRGCCG
jgi:3-isopropylmalate dehydrogenase